MPFTLAHPAAVLPLARRLRPLSALVLGSLAPDLSYFLPLPAGIQGPLHALTHSPAGLVLWTLPVGFVCLVLYASLLRDPLLSLLPERQRRALAPSPPEPFQDPARTAALLALGAATHLVWDSFTHRSGAIVEAIPLLQAVARIGGLEIEVYDVLQYGCSLLGALALVRAYGRWTKSLPAAPAPEVPGFRPDRRHALIGVLALTGASVGLLGGVLANASFHRLGYRTATHGVMYAAAGALLCCWAWHRRRRSTPVPDAALR